MPRSPIRPGQAVTDPDGLLVGDVLAVFDAGDLGTAATVVWRLPGGDRTQFNVGALWLTPVDGEGRDLDAIAPRTCTVCGNPIPEDRKADRYGTCGYSQCADAAWPEYAYHPQPNRVDKPSA